VTVYLINFSHPLSQDAGVEILAKIGDYSEIRIPVQMDIEQSFHEQIVGLVNQVGWKPDDWQLNAFVVNVPALATATAVILSEIHGRCGHWPTILRLKSTGGAVPTWHVAEFVALEQVRIDARQRR